MLGTSPYAHAPTAISWIKRRGHFALFLILAVVEFFIFDTMASRNEAWIFPRWSDQVQYLTEGYTSYETAKREGIVAGFWAAVTKPSAQGMLDCALVLGIFLLVGPSRSAALALNIVFVIAAQLALFIATIKQLRSTTLAWASVALFLCWQTVYSGLPGSGTDFRLDLMAACAFGISLSVLLTTDGLRSRRGALLFGFSIGVTLLVRFLTGAYFLTMAMGLFIWLLFQPDFKRRAINLGLALLVGALLAGPIFWLNRQWILNYYWIGHFIGPESALRNSHMSLWKSFWFLIDRLFAEHLGLPFLAMAGALLLFSWIMRREQAKRPIPEMDRDRGNTREWWIEAVIGCIGPFIVLLLHSQKSAVVVSIIVVPLIAALVGAASRMINSVEFWSEKARIILTPPLQGTFVLLFVALGLANYWFQQSTSKVDAAFARDARRVSAVADKIYVLSERAGLESPAVAVDQTTDGLNGLALRVICYERHKKWVPFIMTLPTGLLRDDEELLMQRVVESDFVFIAVVDTPNPLYPSDAQFRELRQKHLDWCRAHLALIERLELFGRVWELYTNPVFVSTTT